MLFGATVATKLSSTHPMTPGKGPRRRNPPSWLPFPPAYAVVNPLVAAIGVDDSLCHTSQTLVDRSLRHASCHLDPHQWLKWGCGEETQGAEYLPLQRQHRRRRAREYILAEPKVSPKHIIRHVTRVFYFSPEMPALVLSGLQKVKRHSEDHWHSRHHYFSIPLVTGPLDGFCALLCNLPRLL